MSRGEALSDVVCSIRAIAATSDPVVIPLGQWNEIRQAIDNLVAITPANEWPNQRPLITRGPENGS